MLVSLAFLVPNKTTNGGEPKGAAGSWKSGLMLFAYAISFSLAYLSLGSGTGALILFGTVQIVMLVAGFVSGERMGATQWISFFIAVAGFVYLLSPGISAPDLLGALLMTVAGVAWGFYTLAGKGSKAPISMTKGNFVRAVPLALVASLLMSLFALSKIQYEPTGILIALTSGAITSGLAYALWYLVLPKLATTQAAILQLLVPLLATLGGVLFINEAFTLRIAISSALILGGVLFSAKN